VAPVVMLNGTSCAGKTTVGRALVAELGRDGSFWYSLDMDVALWGLPKEWWAWPGHRGAHASRGVSYDSERAGFQDFMVGPDARVVFDSFRVAVAHLARRGAGVVVSTIVFDKREYTGWVAALDARDVTWVAVRAEAELVARRERDRNESYWPGLAAGMST
jgi:chloramphenicol 3-O phosphotransferase